MAFLSLPVSVRSIEQHIIHTIAHDFWKHLEALDNVWIFKMNWKRNIHFGDNRFQRCQCSAGQNQRLNTLLHQVLHSEAFR